VNYTDTHSEWVLWKFSHTQRSYPGDIHLYDKSDAVAFKLRFGV
jgi:hypothetical protein